jgi:hypothetical protein
LPPPASPHLKADFLNWNFKQNFFFTKVNFYNINVRTSILWIKVKVSGFKIYNSTEVVCPNTCSFEIHLLLFQIHFQKIKNLT